MADPVQNVFSDLTEQPMPGPPDIQHIDGATIDRSGSDISVTLNDEPSLSRLIAQTQHDENLAEDMDESDLTKIGQDILAWVEADEQARGTWKNRMENAMELLGLKSGEAKDQVFKGSSTVTHPLIAEACVQFQARAIAEIFPAEGPVKTIVVGVPTPDTIKQAKRVEDYMNFHLTEEDPGYYWDTDKMLFELPTSGSLFGKVYKDPISGLITRRYVKADDFIVPYSAKTLSDAPRYTHRFTMPINDVKRAMAAGFYRDIDLNGPGLVIETDTKKLIDKADDRTASVAPDDDIRTLLECHCDCALPGRDDDAPFSPPYIITVDKDSQKVLSIRRNWDHDDSDKRKIIWFIHYIYLPGLGFYGFGLLHLIGSLGTAATGALRALLDAAARANFPGGFKAKEARKAGEVSPAPGEWIDVDMTAEELNKSFFPLPYKDPSQALMELLKDMVESGQRFSSTTEQMVGDAANTGPVGTTMALIEQGSKVFSGIHKRLHVALRDEFRAMVALISDQMDEVYPYEIGGESRQIMRADFDDRVDVLPVSDPSLSSMTQRIALAQEVLKLVQSAPNIYDDAAQREAHRRVLDAMKVPNIDSLLPGRRAKRLDPVSENQLLMVGKPVQAFSEQEHAAHIQAHQNMVMGVPPEIQKQIQPAVMAHLAEHFGYQYRNQIQHATGPMPAQDLNQPIEDVDPQVDNAISMAVAQLPPQLSQLPGLGPPPIPPEVQQQMEQMQQALEQTQGELQQAQQKEQQAEQAEQQMQMQIQQWQNGTAQELMKIQQAKQQLSEAESSFQMDKERASHDIELQGAQGNKQLTDLRDEIAKLQDQLAQAAQQHATNIDQAHSDHARAMDQARSDAVGEIEKAQADLAVERDKLKLDVERGQLDLEKGIAKLQAMADSIKVAQKATADQAKDKKARDDGASAKNAEKVASDTAKQVQDLIKTLAAPKEIVRGPDGRATGIRPVQ